MPIPSIYMLLRVGCNHLRYYCSAAFTIEQFIHIYVSLIQGYSFGMTPTITEMRDMNRK
jgi:hypothetical protein